MSERVIESASGALRLRVTIEQADLFAMTEADRVAFDGLRCALDRFEGRPAGGPPSGRSPELDVLHRQPAAPVIAKADDPAPIIRVDEGVEARLIAAASQASRAHAAAPPREAECRWCHRRYSSKGLASHERSCQRTNNPDYLEELRRRAAAPVDGPTPVSAPPVDESAPRRPIVSAPVLAVPSGPTVDDEIGGRFLPPLAGLEAAVEATGVRPPGMLGAVSRMFLRDALEAGDDLLGFLTRTPDRTVSVSRRELGLDDDDRTLDWLRAFVEQYRKASAAA